MIRQVRRAGRRRGHPGRGTVLDSETARAAILAGAEYIVSPIVNLDVIRLCRRYDKVVMPGALLRPRSSVRGKPVPTSSRSFRPMSAAPYLKALRGPLPSPPHAHRRCRSGRAEAFLKAPAAWASVGPWSTPRRSPAATTRRSANWPPPSPRSSSDLVRRLDLSSLLLMMTGHRPRHPPAEIYAVCAFDLDFARSPKFSG